MCGESRRDRAGLHVDHVAWRGGRREDTLTGPFRGQNTHRRHPKPGSREKWITVAGKTEPFGGEVGFDHREVQEQGGKFQMFDIGSQ